MKGISVRMFEKMKGISVSMFEGLKRYWRRNDYERLNGSGRRRKNRFKLATMGSRRRRRRRRRFWRMKLKITPKVRFLLIGSPKKFFIRFRDVYVKMMLRFENSTVSNTGFGGALGCGFGRAPLMEYDEKVIVDIYRSLMIEQGKLVPRDAVKIAGEIVDRR